MDFAQLDLKAASERGSWLHLERDGEPLDADGKPCRIHIRGIGDPAVIAACRAVTRVSTLMQDRLNRANDKDAESVVKKFEAKSEEATADMIVAAADQWENINWNGEKMEFNRENLLKICGPGTLFFKQVSEAILEHRRLFTSAATD